MGKKVNPAVVGMFVLGALGLMVLSIALFGSGRLFRRAHRYVIFFSGSVNGLRKGAPVKFKGVEIGEVSQIRLRLEETTSAQQIRSTEVRIPVVIELDEEKISKHGGTQIDLDNPMTIPNLIGEGLRAQLGMDSFVTGLLYVSLDIEPGTPVRMYGPPVMGIQEIPSIPTTLEEAQSVATRIIERLDKVDFPKVIANLTDTLNSIQQLASSPKLKETLASLDSTSKDMSATLGTMRQTLGNVNNHVGPVSKSFQAATGSASAAMAQAKSTLGTVQVAIQPNSPLNYQALQTLQDVSAAAHSVKELADLLQRNPSALVRGRDIPQE
ncbi:MAG TPA: MlaD family protein [Candidatus Binataceae bacterium]|nr:MlaD family protein [Candidatus Binataceae bacterium]